MDTLKKYTKSILAGFVLVTGLTAFSLSAAAQTADGASSDKPDKPSFHHHNGMDSLHRRGGETRFHQDGQMGDRRSGFRHGGPGGEGRFAGRGHGMRGHGRGGHGMDLARRMQFSPEQRKQMQVINSEFHQKQQDLYKNDKMTLGEYKSKLLALQKDKKSREQALLTPEQNDKIARWKKQGAENAQVRAAAHLERMKIKLNLSDDQAARIKTQQADLRAKMKTIRENETLLPQQKMEEMKALFAKRQEGLKSVLTPEQYVKMEAEHAGHNRHWGGGREGNSGQVN